MAQFNWTYVNDAGKKHVLGLYHGARSGHLLVHCNSKIVLIEFNVLASKTYSLFIDDELFELQIERQADTFAYNFEINKEADTPRNRARQVADRQDLYKSIALLAGFILLVSVTVTAVLWSQGGTSETKTAIGRIIGPAAKTMIRFNDLGAPGDSSLEITYSFVVEGRVHSSRSRFWPSAKDHMPIAPGDEFMVTYRVDQPGINFIDLKRPGRSVLEKHRQMAIGSFAARHPELSVEHVACLVDAGFELSGAEAYPVFYHQPSEKASAGETDRELSIEAFLQKIRDKMEREGSDCD